MKYLTNKFKNLPFFNPLTLYYNLENEEVKRNIKKESNDALNLFVVEEKNNRIYSTTTTKEYEYVIDKKPGTFIFFIARPLILLIIAFLLFSHLMYQFYDVLKINTPLTKITFYSCLMLLIFSLYMLLHVFMVAYGKTRPNLKLINTYSKIQYVGFALMIAMFIYFNFYAEFRTTYLYSCMIHLGICSFYTFALFLYVLSPLQMVLNKDLKFYRNKNDKKLIIVEVMEDE